MLSNKVIEWFAQLEIIAEHSKHSMADVPDAAVVLREAQQRSAEYIQQLKEPQKDEDGEPVDTAEERYEDFCKYITSVILVVHERKTPGIGKLSLTKEHAKEDPMHFASLLLKLEQEDLV
jgi:hypothetical protein